VGRGDGPVPTPFASQRRPSRPLLKLSSRWPVYGVSLCALAYAGLKLFWALGGTALIAESPLPPEAIADLQARTPASVLGHWISVALAAAGIVAAFATVSPWGGIFPRWVVLTGTLSVAGLMVFRAVGQIIGGLQRLGMNPPPAARHTITWDLALWSPFFLVWGVLWGAVAWRYARLDR
jgi:Protein of unknown function (DUF3995)